MVRQNLVIKGRKTLNGCTINLNGRLHSYTVGDLDSMLNCLKEVEEEFNLLSNTGFYEGFDNIRIDIEREDQTVVDSIEPTNAFDAKATIIKMLTV